MVDGKPYGGGVGMILKADVLARALQKTTTKRIGRRKAEDRRQKIILTSASGTPYKQSKAEEYSKLNHLIIVCGHYEGVDQRFTDKYVDEEISIGDYVLTGGEIPAMVITDTVVRLIPGVLEKPEATKNESFSDTLLEHPQYTRPEEFEGIKIPQVLLSGNHKKITEWRKQKALEKTKKIRPDLIK